MEATKKESRLESQKKYVESYLKPLVGGTIIAFGAVAEDEDEFDFAEVWPVLRVKLSNGETVDLVVSRDEEGNGAGHLFVEAIGPF